MPEPGPEGREWLWGSQRGGERQEPAEEKREAALQHPQRTLLQERMEAVEAAMYV